MKRALSIGSILVLLLLAFFDRRSHDEAKSTVKVTRRDLNDTGSLNNAVASNVTTPGILEDEYSCKKGKPCSNGACCGSEGVCGYGPVYCGDGCISNCDAHAECGQYAENPGQECPLNVW